MRGAYAVRSFRLSPWIVNWYWALLNRRRDAELSKLQAVQRYAYTKGCRRAFILRYFGDPAARQTCEGCDNCLEPRERFDATTIAQKFLSCVYRIRRASGFAVGLKHIVDVLTGKVTEKVARFGHAGKIQKKS